MKKLKEGDSIGRCTKHSKHYNWHEISKAEDSEAIVVNKKKTVIISKILKKGEASILLMQSKQKAKKGLPNSVIWLGNVKRQRLLNFKTLV